MSVHAVTSTFAVNCPVHIGAVELAVADAATMTDFYTRGIGLTLLEKTASGAVLGVGNLPLVTLVQDKSLQPASRRLAGLFHTAILVPNRHELGRWLAHAVHAGVRLEGASDHLVSEAIYLSDPEGNGIEIYRDRADSEWKYNADGSIEMATLGLDLQRLYDETPKGDFGGMVDGTVIGHIHLQVGNVTEAEGFYHDLLGLDVMAHYPGASFMASGGYHHHLGTNTWNSRGAGTRPDKITGLSRYTLAFKDKALRDEKAAQLAAKGHETLTTNEGIAVKDPWGINILLAA